MSLYNRIADLRDRIEYARPLVSIQCDEDGFEVVAIRPDTYTGEQRVGYGGHRTVTDDMSDSQIVRAMFGALLAFEEHEAREAFTFDGARIFGPHIDVDAL